MATQKKKKADIYTKEIMLSYTPETHAKIKFIAKQNKLTLSEQLRRFITNLIEIYERKYGVIDTEEKKEEKPDS